MQANLSSEEKSLLKNQLADRSSTNPVAFILFPSAAVNRNRLVGSPVSMHQLFFEFICRRAAVWRMQADRETREGARS